MKLVQTCIACPEQYDVLDEDDEKIGYLRLRHGRFTAEYLDTLVYEADTIGDGMFDPSERDYHLARAMWAIHRQRILE